MTNIIHYDDDTESTDVKPDFTMTPEEAEQLHNYIEFNGYISSEFHPLVINIARRLRVYVED